MISATTASCPGTGLIRSQADSFRPSAAGLIRDRIGLDHAALLQPLDALGNAWRRQADRARQIGRAGARILFEQAQDLQIRGIEIGIFVSKAFHEKILAFGQ